MLNVIRKSRKQKDRSRYGIELVSILDVNGCVVYASESHTTVLGYSVDDILYRNVFELVHPQDHALVLERFFAMASSGEMTQVDFRIAHKDGRWIEVRAEGVPTVQNALVNGYLIVSNARVAVTSDDVRKRANTQFVEQVLNRYISVRGLH